MLDIQTLSIAVATVSVVAGVMYYSFQLRNQSKTRQTDLLVRLYSVTNGKDWLEAWEKVIDREVMDHSDYKKKYGFVEFNEVYSFFLLLGVLLRRRLVDIDLVHDIFQGQIKVLWEKVKPIIEGGRKRFNDPSLGKGFEYLYDEMKKREQRLQQIQQ